MDFKKGYSVLKSLGALRVSKRCPSDQESIKIWRENHEHIKVQELGKSHFYSWYEIQVVKVERGYSYTYSNKMEFN